MSAAASRKNIIAGNWKMNLGMAASRELARALVGATSALSQSEVWVAPSSMALAAVSEELKGSSIQCGAQNVCQQKSGAFTGELSVSMLKEVGCTFALTGHSERRNVFGESNELCVARTLAAIEQDLTAVLCIGETLEEREKGTTFAVVESQLIPVLQKLSREQTGKLVVAYEPVWAIGTGKVASVEQIAEVHQHIAMLMTESHGADLIPPILYGGSVTADNFASIITLPHVSGALVGGASLQAEKFLPLIQISEG